jgi:glyoxylase-like metal-dependent hydrolase (beta-lactamase superfamily II)
VYPEFWIDLEELDMTKYKIIPLVLADLEADKSDMMYLTDRGVMIHIPVVSFYISGGDKHILVDAGAPAEIISRYHSAPARDIQSFEEALGKQGLEPEDIDIVIQTHLHFDHCGNTAKCKRAEVIVQEEELKFALAPHPICAVPYGATLLQGLKFRQLRGDVEIIDGIRLLYTPGHTPGGQSVAIETAKGTAIIAGFCSISENFNVSPEVRAVRPDLAVYAPGVHTDAIAGYESALKVKGLADILIPPHALELIGIEAIP